MPGVMTNTQHEHHHGDQMRRLEIQPQTHRHMHRTPCTMSLRYQERLITKQLQEENSQSFVQTQILTSNSLPKLIPNALKMFLTVLFYPEAPGGPVG